eukprot:1953708-Karenia_brevis.AAC.1
MVFATSQIPELLLALWMKCAAFCQHFEFFGHHYKIGRYAFRAALVEAITHAIKPCSILTVVE